MHSMLFCMRTTLNLDDNLMRSAKESAARTGKTLTTVIEDALRVVINSGQRAADHPFDPVVSEGRPLPGVDIDDSAALLDLMSDDVPD